MTVPRPLGLNFLGVGDQSTLGDLLPFGFGAAELFNRLDAPRLGDPNNPSRGPGNALQVAGKPINF